MMRGEMMCTKITKIPVVNMHGLEIAGESRGNG